MPVWISASRRQPYSSFGLLVEFGRLLRPLANTLIIFEFEFPPMRLPEFNCAAREVRGCCQESLCRPFMGLDPVEGSKKSDPDLMRLVVALTLDDVSDLRFGLPDSYYVSPAISSSRRELDGISKAVPNPSDELFEFSWRQTH